MSCNKCKQTQCSCRKVPLGSTLDVLPITPNCITPSYCSTGCEETISAECAIMAYKDYCFLKDRFGQPIKTGISVQNVLEGLDKLICELKKKVDECCGVQLQKTYFCAPTDACRLVLLKRNNVTISVGKVFQNKGELLTYLQQYDDFVLDVNNISVKSIFTWTVDLECEQDSCPLDIEIIPYNQPETC